jgi:beta-lactamase regulating signal transducer with metallopeptidase domain
MISMSLVYQSAQLFVLAIMSFVALGSLVSTVIIVAVSARVLKVDPQLRHRVLVLLASLPALIAAAVFASASLPSLIALAVPALDHCLVHDDGHAHLCFRHLQRLQTSIPLLLTLVFLVVYVGLRVAFFAAAAVRASRLLRSLARTGQTRPDLGVTVVETPRALCLAASAIQPEILISRGLLDALDSSAQRVVLAHERTHILRRHALAANVVRACCCLHIPSVSRWLRRELAVAAEQVCDESAAKTVGDRLAVASTILAVERIAQGARADDFGAIAMAFGKVAIERRVESLLSEPLPAASMRPVYIAFALATAVLMAGANGIHHAAESLLSVVVQ